MAQVVRWVLLPLLLVGCVKFDCRCPQGGGFTLTAQAGVDGDVLAGCQHFCGKEGR